MLAEQKNETGSLQNEMSFRDQDSEDLGKPINLESSLKKKDGWIEIGEEKEKGKDEKGIESKPTSSVFPQ